MPQQPGPAVEERDTSEAFGETVRRVLNRRALARRDGAAEFVDLVGALMKGCIDTEMTKPKYVTLKSQPARERQLSKVVGAVMWPLMEVLLVSTDVEYRVKGKDLVS